MDKVIETGMLDLTLIATGAKAKAALYNATQNYRQKYLIDYIFN